MKSSLQNSKPWYSTLPSHTFSLYLSFFSNTDIPDLFSLIPSGHSATLFHPSWTLMLFPQLLFHRRKNKVHVHDSKACSCLPLLVQASQSFMAHATYNLQFPIAVCVLGSTLQVLSQTFCNLYSAKLAASDFTKAPITIFRYSSFSF